MTTVTLEFADNVFAATRSDPEGFTQDMRLTAAISWYRSGRISQETAASVAGMDRTDFLLALARNGSESFAVDFDELDRELARD